MNVGQRSSFTNNGRLNHVQGQSVHDQGQSVHDQDQVVPRPVVLPVGRSWWILELTRGSSWLLELARRSWWRLVLVQAVERVEGELGPRTMVHGRNHIHRIRPSYSWRLPPRDRRRPRRSLRQLLPIWEKEICESQQYIFKM